MTAPLTVVVTSFDNPVQTQAAVRFLRTNSEPSLTHIVVVDNGSLEPYPMWDADQLVRYPENTGGNAVMHSLIREGQIARTVLTAFLHCDMMVLEKGWDFRVINAFLNDPRLGLVGFVGSNEIDERGGRGGGTMLNYIGAIYEGIGVGSPAEHHGRRIHDLQPGAVLDHCSMIFRTSVLEGLTPQVKGQLAPEHFADRYWSCEVLEHAYRVGVFGIACDHFSGGTGPGVARMDDYRRRWLESEGVHYDPTNLSLSVYLESERRFHARFLATGFIPLRVNQDWSITHQHRLRGGTWP